MNSSPGLLAIPSGAAGVVPCPRLWSRPRTPAPRRSPQGALAVPGAQPQRSPQRLAGTSGTETRARICSLTCWLLFHPYPFSLELRAVSSLRVLSTATAAAAFLMRVQVEEASGKHRCSRKASSFSSQHSSAAGPQATLGRPAGAVTVPSVPRCVALHPYVAHGPEELELQKGEGVRVFGKEQDGWLRGMSLVTGRVGVFPSNYVAPLFRSGFYYTKQKYVEREEGKRQDLGSSRSCRATSGWMGTGRDGHRREVGTGQLEPLGPPLRPPQPRHQGHISLCLPEGF